MFIYCIIFFILMKKNNKKQKLSAQKKPKNFSERVKKVDHKKHQHKDKPIKKEGKLKGVDV